MNTFPGMGVRMVCCIDEAHELLKKCGDTTYFVTWRRQILKIKWQGFFNILLSTNRKVGNFVPPTIKDTPSARDHQYELFLDVHTIDVLAELAPPGKEYNPRRALYLGTPLWGSFAQAGVDIYNILQLASRKIRHFEQDKRLANLACMSCSFALEIYPRIEEVEILVTSHMATALGVSLDRSDLLCTYPSDLILASGSLKGIINIGLENWLDTLLEHFSRGVIEAGERGELVFRILFLDAYIRVLRDKSEQKEPTYLEKIPLSSFLKNFCGEISEKVDKLLEEMGISNANIGFNHWISLIATNKNQLNVGNKYLSTQLIANAYHRHAAFKMSHGFPIIDYVIPFEYSGSYGIISVQNKNHKVSTFIRRILSI